jgi:high affinity Mn2+ porin
MRMLLGALAAFVIASPALAQDDQQWAVHTQGTFTEQYHPDFTSPYRGPQSLDPGSRGNETADATLYAGVRLTPGTEVWIDPEIDQGFGLSNTLGIAGYASGEAYKVGQSAPYFRLQRFFVRQTFDLGGERQEVAPDLNQLAGHQTSNRIVVTAGKLSVTDVFDTNGYAHDPRNDFLNWSLIDTGSFDYAADAWGYTMGAAIEWYQGRWVFRVGVFDLSTVPNSKRLDDHFGQFQTVSEIERDYDLLGHPGKIKATGFVTRARMGSYQAAVDLADQTNQPANTALVRYYSTRTGVGLSVEQELTPSVGAFARVGGADGHREVYEFTDIDQSLAGGLSVKGTAWGRPDDEVGLAGVGNDISRVHTLYLADGGTGLLIGDGRLPHKGPEIISETYYQFPVASHVRATIDYQYVVNPAYNEDRGPVSIFGLRLHYQY